MKKRMSIIEVFFHSTIMLSHFLSFCRLAILQICFSSMELSLVFVLLSGQLHVPMHLSKQLIIGRDLTYPSLTYKYRIN